MVHGQLTARTEAMSRGQAERLMPLLEELLQEAGLAYGKCDALAVGIGPGNFTGIRIAVSAARGLSLGLGVPCFGISSFDMLRGDVGHGAEIVSLPAPRDQCYVQAYRDGAPQGAPRLIDPASPPGDLGLHTAVVVRGHRAAEIARALGATAEEVALTDHAARMVPLAARRLARQTPPGRPAPLYVRPADAAPPSDPPPVILP
ncbi:tRNA threonylcarbamoyladenosine biosynthesis protein TsaB [Roseisalinus antarcticus]|uniref:tRNA threonylcarbamoyladenosine biosynthesis protein TsaB n=2 Tax=Roseisalinus antarcticus TaxID=254357 RepID=A0A1Y5RRR2_9RHOB|nr:tRNA threonylcarbamoyladenosine biosynthesis protein TsaB [Roseisalinus antarcticus]